MEPKTYIPAARSGHRYALWAVGLLILTAVWLWVSVDGDRSRTKFFGLWRMRHVAVAAVWLWLAVAAGLLAMSARPCSAGYSAR